MFEITGCRFFQRDVATLRAADVKPYLPVGTYRVLAGCAPCQPFSTYSRTRKGDDNRWGLVKHFVRLALQLRPHVVTMENVPQLVHHEVFSQAVTSLRRSGYAVWWSVVDCADYGVPQTRKRLVLLGSRLGPLVLLPPRRRQHRTVREMIGDLPSLVAGQVDRKDPLHRACSLTLKNLQRMRTSKPGGSWRDWEPELRAPCHHRKSGSTFPSVYARMAWDALGPTITTQYFGFGNGRFGHPQQDRAISLREGAILQTFPKSYAIEPPDCRMSAQRVGRLIGNAVPPALALHVGRAIVKHLASFSG
jgi:DNA (cytosine-5)-methyltransferase 1